ncbi:response regulator [Pseudomonas sp. B21-054]|nr:response regulator [Pseudomonas sp. B21-054]
MASEFLSDTGYRVVEALDSVSALKHADKLGSIDLLLTDIGLPGTMNGISLAEEMKARYPQLKVLFITGFAEGESLVRVDATTRILTKPFSLNDLSQRVSSLLHAGDDGASPV